MKSDWKQIRDIFSGAIELHIDEREGYVRQRCSGNKVWFREIISLLQAHEHPGPLDRPLRHIGENLAGHEKLLAGPAIRKDGLSGTMVGPYRIIRIIGTGGMGHVYLARRNDDQFTQEVAIKLLPRGVTSENQTLRFLAERQILAGLDHPHIARLLDGGITEYGQPWFAMEYVDGVPIERFSREHQLSVNDRLRLFLMVCDAVQHAHQKLVIHRDLKPSNILIKKDGSVRLLDFGIAKSLNDDDFIYSRPPDTKTGLLPLTPAYASPEQIRGDAITTASDIYQLGMVLYEVLTGCRPYEVSGCTPGEMEQIICVREPRKPSTAVFVNAAERTAGPSGASDSVYVSPPAADAEPDVAGPADAVRADAAAPAEGEPAEKVPAEGEPSVAAPAYAVRTGPGRITSPEQLKKRLKGDLDTIILKALSKEPARRYESAEKLASDISAYLRGKPVSAHPDSMMYRTRKFVSRHKIGVASTTAIILLLAGYALTLTWQVGQTRQALDQAREEALKAGQVTALLMEMFEANNPDSYPGSTITADNLLEAGVRQAEALQGQPGVQAQMLDLAGRIYMNLGLYDKARSLMEQSLELREQIHPPRHAEIGESLHNLGVLHWRQGRYGRAEEQLREALAILQENYSGNHESLAATMGALAVVLKEMRNFDEAEQLYRSTLAMGMALFGENHEAVAHSLNNLGKYFETTGNYREAEHLYHRSLAIYRDLYGERHSAVAGRLNNLGVLRLLAGSPHDALPWLEEAVEIRRQVFGERHPDVAESLYNLGDAYMELEWYNRADSSLKQALAIQQEALQPSHPKVAQTLNLLGIQKQRTGDLDSATIYYRQALAIQAETLGRDHSEVGIQLNNIGLLLIRQERYDEARDALGQSIEILNAVYGDVHPLQTYPLLGMGHVYLRTHEPAKAESFFRKALQIQQATAEQDDWNTGNTKSWLGYTLAGQQKYDEAEPFLLQGYEILDRELGRDHSRTQSALERVIDLYRHWNKEDMAHAWRVIQTN
jgi:eukaryotic-like serine/threonine-protein kinase